MNTKRKLELELHFLVFLLCINHCVDSVPVGHGFFVIGDNLVLEFASNH